MQWNSWFTGIKGKDILFQQTKGPSERRISSHIEGRFNLRTLCSWEKIGSEFSLCMPIFHCTFRKRNGWTSAIRRLFATFSQSCWAFRTIGIGLEVDNLRYHPTISAVFARIALALVAVTRFRIDEPSVNLSSGQSKKPRKKPIKIAFASWQVWLRAIYMIPEWLSFLNELIPSPYIRLLLDEEVKKKLSLRYICFFQLTKQISFSSRVPSHNYTLLTGFQDSLANV